MSQSQVLVQFDNNGKTVIVWVPNDADSCTKKKYVLSFWSDTTGWPIDNLRITLWAPPFCTITSISQILGGKGGFGTLLKGQSRQAGARLTTDFGACRDLQGRRLRHVNDEIKLRKWRDMERRKQEGEKVADDELWKTPSGLYNWHLMTPTWADISKKATYRIKRQFQKINQEALKEAELKKEKEEAYQKSMTMYLEKATLATQNIQEDISDAIKQGLAAASNSANSKKRKVISELESSNIIDNPNSLCTLSGEMVVEMTKTKRQSIQSKSDFATAVLVLDRAPPKDCPILYYEVTIVTGGLAQIGWAYLFGDTPFSPNNDLGDGVGDDSSSFGVDGSRKLKFHAGLEKACGSLEWKEGDRLGCYWNTQEGTLSFTVNGHQFDQAGFETNFESLVPAFSCNLGEILELHTTKEDCLYFPKTNNAIAVQDLLLAPTRGEKGTANKNTIEANRKPKAVKTVTTSVKTSIVPIIKAPTQPEPLNLEPYNSAKELEEVGPERLKSALMALQCKCGGTVTERALRLFSLKGLNRKEYPKKVRAKNFVE